MIGLIVENKKPANLQVLFSFEPLFCLELRLIGIDKYNLFTAANLFDIAALFPGF